jgi:hypothetical protein
MLSVLVLAVAACDPAATTDGNHTVTDSAGIRIVVSHSPAWGDPRTIDPEPLLRIGGEEGPYLFGALYRAILLPDGGIAAVEGMSREIRLFDTSGNHVRTFGGPGSGPGEFQVVTGLFEHAGDSIAAYDQLARRATVFPLGDGVPRVVRTADDQNLDLFGRLHDGAWLAYNPGQYRHGRPQGLQWDTTDVVAIDPRDGSTTVIVRLPGRERLIDAEGQDADYIGARFASQAAADSGFYWAIADHFEIAYHDASGALRRILRRPVQAPPLDDAMTAEWIEAQLAFVRQYEGDEAANARRTRFEASRRAERAPLFGPAFVDGDQRLWVSAATWPPSGTPRTWSVFAPDGVWLGDVVAPDGVRLRDARGDTVLGIWQDELDVPWIQLHALRGGQ